MLIEPRDFSDSHTPTHFGFTHFSLRIRQMLIEARDFSDAHTCGRLRDTSVRETENDAQGEFIETDFH